MTQKRGGDDVQIGRVCGTVVATLKHQALHGQRLLLVQPHDPHGVPVGETTLALDVVDAGVGDWVLLVDEGSSASLVLGMPRGPVRTVIVGVLDAVQVPQASRRGAAIDAPTRG